MDKEILIKRIEQLCEERKIKPTTAFNESGVGKNFKSNLNTANPSLGKVTLLANYFGVSREYLLGETENRQKEKALQEIPEGLSELDAEIIKVYSTLPEEKKQQALSYLEFLLKQGGE